MEFLSSTRPLSHRKTRKRKLSSFCKQRSTQASLPTCCAISIRVEEKRLCLEAISHTDVRGAKRSIFIANVIAIKITILPFLTFTFNIPNIANPDLSLNRPTVIDVPRSSPYKTHTIGVKLVMHFGVGLDKCQPLICQLGANRKITAFVVAVFGNSCKIPAQSEFSSWLKSRIRPRVSLVRHRKPQLSNGRKLSANGLFIADTTQHAHFGCLFWLWFVRSGRYFRESNDTGQANKHFHHKFQHLS